MRSKVVSAFGFTAFACRLVDLASLVDVLLEHLSHRAVQTRVAVLRWIHHLHSNAPERLFKHMDRLFPQLVKMISDAADEVHCAIYPMDTIRSISYC